MKKVFSALIGIMLLLSFGCAIGQKEIVTSAVQDQGVLVAKEIGYLNFRHFDSNGNLLWEQDAALNALADEGESIFLDCTLRATSCPTTFYLRLSDSTSTCSIAETDTLTLASAGEPSTYGYAAQEVTRNSSGWVTLALDSGDYMATSSEETFSASGGSWGPVYCAFVGTTSDNTGKLIAYAALSTGRTLASGESLKVTYKIKQQ